MSNLSIIVVGRNWIGAAAELLSLSLSLSLFIFLSISLSLSLSLSLYHHVRL
jgi:hypothetical protein